MVFGASTLVALRRFNPRLLDVARVHVLDATPSVDDCVHSLLQRNGFATKNLVAHRTVLQGNRTGTADYRRCLEGTPRSRHGSCTFDGGQTGNPGDRVCGGNLADVLESVAGEIDVVGQCQPKPDK